MNVVVIDKHVSGEAQQSSANLIVINSYLDPFFEPI
jgi:hypothetical protein